MSKHYIRYLTFLLTGFSIITMIFGSIAISETWIRYSILASTVLLAIIGIFLYFKFRDYENGIENLNEIADVFKVRNLQFEVRNLNDESELKSIWLISQKIYKKNNVPFPVVKSWWQAYPKGVYVLFKGTMIAGYFSMWPLYQKSYDRITSGKQKEKQLKDEDIIPLESNELKRSWYITNIVMRKNFRYNRDALKILLRGMLTKWETEIQNCDQIQFCTFGFSKQGKNIIERFGFEKILEEDETSDKKPLYVYTNSRENIGPFIRRLR